MKIAHNIEEKNQNELIKDFKFYSDYSKYDPELGRRETWEESVQRVMDMHYRKYKENIHENEKLAEYFNYAYKAYEDQLVLGSQRALQFGGQPIEDANAKIYNCVMSYIDRPEAFQELMYVLLCGCGAGFSVQKHHVEELPTIQKRTNRTKRYEIPDSIEGWSDAIGVLLSSYMTGDDAPFPSYQGKTVHFDYSNIRPRGAFITGGFKAPGPDGLKRSIEKIEALLDSQFNEDENEVDLRPIVAYDIIMHMSDAVLSGGVRRSATICLFSKDDYEMINAKIGNWLQENPQRARSNNSVVLERDEVSHSEFMNIYDKVKEYGEPGFIFTEDKNHIPNPCVEVQTKPVHPETGESGMQFCNLTEGNGSKIETKEDFFRMCKASAIMGTFQAGYTDFDYLGKTTEEITENEALLGCSITGMMSNPDLLFDEELQRQGAELIKEVNKEVAEMIGINQSARTTCIKPSGNSSVMLGTTPATNAWHHERFIRNVQVNKDEFVGKVFDEENPKAVDNSVWSANNTDWVISFPMVAPDGAKFKHELSAIDQLEYVKLTQNNWVEYGTNEELCVDKDLRHNVSNTINVGDDEWDEVGEYIYQNREHFAGISLLGKTGDKDYNQAPYVAVYTSEEIMDKYGHISMFASGLIVDGIHAFGNLWKACDTFLGNGNGEDISEETSENALKRDWVRRAKQFSERYFEDDKTMTYCLKDVHNYHKWVELNRELDSIDWTEYTEEPEYTNIDTMGASACAGGACSVPDWLLEEQKK